MFTFSLLLLSLGFIGRMLISKYLLPLNKMANRFLMVYPIVTRVIILSSESNVHLSMGCIVCCNVIYEYRDKKSNNNCNKNLNKNRMENKSKSLNEIYVQSYN